MLLLFSPSIPQHAFLILMISEPVTFPMLSARATVNVMADHRSLPAGIQQTGKKVAMPTSTGCNGSNNGGNSCGYNRLPASIQAMLLRSRRDLSRQEMKIMANTTADDRCVALRMVFEGQSADDAIAFLLEGGRARNLPSNSPMKQSSPHSIDDLRTPTSSMESVTAINCDTNCTAVFHESSISMGSVSPIDASVTFRSMTSIWDSELLTDCGSSNSNAERRSISPPIRLPSPHKQEEKALQQSLCDLDVNILRNELAGNLPVQPCTSSAAATPTVSGSPTSNRKLSCKAIKTPVCSAWDDRFRTYIVHPNQLKRLEELEMLRCSPDAVRPGSTSAFRRLGKEERTVSPVDDAVARRLRARRFVGTRQGMSPITGHMATQARTTSKEKGKGPEQESEQKTLKNDAPHTPKSQPPSQSLGSTTSVCAFI
uniref:Uncharacterized protein n=1 Tax=Trypanosoma congolense (strain IL3000) TaxID=1068625 RepID=G0UY32_TRYCI|nr:conserved hypothetical protein [Trypanosoma congolense IL3000]